ncbi:hypothetical protein LY78DRAFT_101380 [Colletotrichum sublineola]|nr:hypothetical protein LY78DRAFT_101380 [Colletotrichum sublineola]
MGRQGSFAAQIARLSARLSSIEKAHLPTCTKVRMQIQHVGIFKLVSTTLARSGVGPARAHLGFDPRLSEGRYASSTANTCTLRSLPTGTLWTPGESAARTRDRASSFWSWTYVQYHRNLGLRLSIYLSTLGSAPKSLIPQVWTECALACLSVV